MADRRTNASRHSPHSRLRDANNSLLENLKQGQKQIRSILKTMQEEIQLNSTLNRNKLETSFSVRGLNGTPSSVQRSERPVDYVRKTDTSTPKTYSDALKGPGNDRRTKKLNTSTTTTPNSILRNSISNRSKKSPKKGLHVSFHTDENRKVLDDNLNRRSMLGYDWIAGILDNTSYLTEKNDDFFDDLKEFRRSNKDECYSKALESPLIQPFLSTTPSTKFNDGDDDTESKDIYSRESTYRLNERLFAEKVHSPDVSCGVCYTKPPPEYETEGSYVRVSVPRSTLMSPYKVKPHRRVSFDPTDSIGLSSHCLAGWESSKPAAVPPPTSLDLRASLHKTKETLEASRAGRFSPDFQSTKDLLNRSHSLRYGLQVLDMERGMSENAHTTPYPAF